MRLFASEAKGLLRALPDLEHLMGKASLSFWPSGAPWGRRTLFRGVQLLPGASVWSFQKRKVSQEEIFFS